MTATTIDRAPAQVAPRPHPRRSRSRRLMTVELSQDVRHPRRLLADDVAWPAPPFIATASVILFAPDSAMTYDNFGAAIGVPDDRCCCR